MREESDRSLLRRAGFVDPARAEALLADKVLADVDRHWLVSRLSEVGDPDQGLLAYIRLLDGAYKEGKNAQDALYETCADDAAARRLFAVLGMSSALGDMLVSRPSNVHILQTWKVGGDPLHTSLEREKADALRAVHADPFAVNPVAALTGEAGINALRAHYWYRVTQLASADLTAHSGPEAMPAVGESMAHIVGGALEAALAVGRAEVPGSEKIGLAVMAMGKTGAAELNYISDVDVVYVARALPGATGNPDETGATAVGELGESEVIAIATKLATFLARAVMGAVGNQRVLWQLDANLRPEGKDGPLVRTLDSHMAYYKRWAKDWEFQALLKARPIAGDMELGEEYVAAMAPMVWTAAARPNFVEDSRSMRKRVEDLVPKREADRQLKLGKGGLRDVEFTVQLLQLVHGRTDESLRVRNTLEGLAALRDGGYVARHDAERLDAHYRFLRTLEHRIQLQRVQRSHLVPTAELELRRIARTMHVEGIGQAEELEARWQEVRREVRELHLEIYYRPLLPQTARLSADDVSLQSDAAQARLAAIGYRDPKSAVRNIEALTSGLSRTAAIQRQLLPVMIGWFSDGPEPDHGLAAFRTISEKMGSTSWYMRTLRDSGTVAERLAHVLASSRYLAHALPSLSEAISWLDDDEQLRPRTRAELDVELASLLSRRTEPEEIASAGRYLRRRELLRTGLAYVVGVIDAAEGRRAVSTAADIAIEAGLRGAVNAACAAHGLEEPPSDYLVVAMGRLGGAEIGYASDADVMFVHEPHDGVDAELAQKVAIDVGRSVTQLLGSTSAEPPLPVDADLRPEGRNGPLSRTLDSYAEYYERWVEMWERQALLRARPCAGSTELGERFVALIDPLRYPEGGLTTAQAREIRQMKARVERERMPRGVDPNLQLKLGRGGLSDVEWTVQLLQLQHAGAIPELRVTGTLEGLAALAESGVLSEADADLLRESWSQASVLRDANVLGTGRTQGSKIDVLPHESDSLGVIASLLGVDAGSRHDIQENYLRSARRARQVVERVFFGE